MPYLIVALNNFSLKGVKGYASNWKEFGKWQNKNLISGRDILEPATVTKIKDLVKQLLVHTLVLLTGIITQEKMEELKHMFEEN